MHGVDNFDIIPRGKICDGVADLIEPIAKIFPSMPGYENHAAVIGERWDIVLGQLAECLIRVQFISRHIQCIDHCIPRNM